MYTYKVESYEARNDSIEPKIACLVQAFDESGNMLKHETVIVDAPDIDVIVSANVFDNAKLTDAVISKAAFCEADLDAIVTERLAKEAAYLQAKVVVDKVQVKLAVVKELPTFPDAIVIR